MTTVFKRTSSLIAVILLLVVMATGISKAQVTTGGGNGFRISPVRNEFTIEKGGSQQFPITIENPTDATVVAQPVVNDFVSSENETGEPRLILDDSTPAPKNSFKTLVNTPSELTLGPREQKEIQVTIRIPENANSGGYYGTIRFVPAPAPGAGNVGLTASVGTIILVRVPGNLTERLDLIELTSSQNGKAKSFLTGGDVSVMTRIKNSGDIHLQPFGKIQVKDMFGKVVHEYEFNNVTPRANILPDSTRRFEDAIPKQKFLGRYTINLNLGVSQGSGELIVASTSFWYIPLWAIGVIVVLIAALVAGGYYLYRRYGLSKPKHGLKKK